MTLFLTSVLGYVFVDPIGNANKIMVLLHPDLDKKILTMFKT